MAQYLDKEPTGIFTSSLAAAEYREYFQYMALICSLLSRPDFMDAFETKPQPSSTPARWFPDYELSHDSWV